VQPIADSIRIGMARACSRRQTDSHPHRASSSRG
jgi:hypothetical protein